MLSHILAIAKQDNINVCKNLTKQSTTAADYASWLIKAQSVA